MKIKATDYAQQLRFDRYLDMGFTIDQAYALKKGMPVEVDFSVDRAYFHIESALDEYEINRNEMRTQSAYMRGHL